MSFAFAAKFLLRSLFSLEKLSMFWNFHPPFSFESFSRVFRFIFSCCIYDKSSMVAETIRRENFLYFWRLAVFFFFLAAHHFLRSEREMEEAQRGNVELTLFNDNRKITLLCHWSVGGGWSFESWINEWRNFSRGKENVDTVKTMCGERGCIENVGEKQKKKKKKKLRTEQKKGTKRSFWIGVASSGI